MDDKTWYRGGLKFQCAQCGSCCTGAPGYVWVNKEELETLAVVVGEEEVQEFERKHVRKIGVRKSLKEYPNGDCVFFDKPSGRCVVYDARPRQCRTWPFWESNLRTPAHWERTCEACPGSGRGPTHRAEEIERQRQVTRI